MLYQHIPNKYYFASEVKEYHFKALEGQVFFSWTDITPWSGVLDDERRISVTSVVRPSQIRVCTSPVSRVLITGN